MDFTVENPGHGKLWNLECMTPVLRCCCMPGAPIDDQARQLLAKVVPTSYCKYGSGVRKDTNFMTSLGSLRLQPPCSKAPCKRRKAGLLHLAQVQGSSQEGKNAIPETLMHKVFDSWVQKHHSAGSPKPTLVLLDVFAGFGSVGKAVRSHEQDILYVSNDINKSRGADFHEDMRESSLVSTCSLMLHHVLKDRPEFKSALPELQAVALDSSGAGEDEKAKHFARLLRSHNVCVLVHMSPPCETYSTASGNTHRDGGSVLPLSEKARQHDAMAGEMVASLKLMASATE